MFSAATFDKYKRIYPEVASRSQNQSRQHPDKASGKKPIKIPGNYIH